MAKKQEIGLRKISEIAGPDPRRQRVAQLLIAEPEIARRAVHTKLKAEFGVSLKTKNLQHLMNRLRVELYGFGGVEVRPFASKRVESSWLPFQHDKPQRASSYAMAPAAAYRQPNTPRHFYADIEISEPVFTRKEGTRTKFVTIWLGAMTPYAFQRKLSLGRGSGGIVNIILGDLQALIPKAELPPMEAITVLGYWASRKKAPVEA